MICNQRLMGDPGSAEPRVPPPLPGTSWKGLCCHPCALPHSLVARHLGGGGCSSILSFFFVFLGPHPLHMEVPRLGVELELQLPAYTTATAMCDPRHVCDLHHSSWQHWNLNPPSEARDQTLVIMGTSWVRYRCATMGTPCFSYS